MLKEQLLEAVASSETAQITEALSEVFESVQMSDEVKNKLGIVFESLVKSKAVELAESHIDIANTKAEELIESHKKELSEAADDYGKFVAEQMETKVDTYLDHVVEKWLEDNKLALESGLKVEMFDNLVGGLKEMFTENNIIVPEDSIDVVKELEEQATELEERLDKAITEGVEFKNQAKKYRRDEAVMRVTEGLADSQVERVQKLAEILDINEDTFEDQLKTIVEFATGTSLGTISEKCDDDKDKMSKKEDEGEENYKPSDKKDSDDDKKDMKESEEDPQMAAFLAAV